MNKFCENCPNAIRCGSTLSFLDGSDFECTHKKEMERNRYFIGREIFDFVSSYFPNLGNERTLRTHLPEHCEPRESKSEMFCIRVNSMWSIGNPINEHELMNDYSRDDILKLKPECDLSNEKQIAKFLGCSRQWVNVMVNSGTIPVFWPLIGNRPWSAKKWLEPYKKPTDRTATIDCTP